MGLCEDDGAFRPLDADGGRAHQRLQDLRHRPERLDRRHRDASPYEEARLPHVAAGGPRTHRRGRRGRQWGSDVWRICGQDLEDPVADLVRDSLTWTTTLVSERYLHPGPLG